MAIWPPGSRVNRQGGPVGGFLARSWPFGSSKKVGINHACSEAAAQETGRGTERFATGSGPSRVNEGDPTVGRRVRTAQSRARCGPRMPAPFPELRRKVEPGGFEPPCRNSQPAASTPCSRHFNLGSLRRGTTPFARTMTDKFLVPPRPVSPLEPARCFQPPLHRASNGGCRGPNQAARAYCELADMNLHPFNVSRCSTTAQRRAFPARSIPFGP